MKLTFLLCFIASLCAFGQDTITIKGTVKANDRNEAVEKAIIHLQLSGGYTFSQKTDTAGAYIFKFLMSVPSSCTLSISSDKETKARTISKGCFFMSKEKATISELSADRHYVKDFLLSPARHCGEPYFSPILFNTNSIISCNDSLNNIDTAKYYRFERTVNDLLRLLKDNPTVVLEFVGHASSLENKNAENIALYRAQLMCEVLIAKGIDRKRLQAKGFGNRKLIVTDQQIKKASTAQEKLALHLKNQRVIFRIVSWDYVKISEEEVPDIEKE